MTVSIEYLVRTLIRRKKDWFTNFYDHIAQERVNY